MTALKKILESKTWVQYQDCDDFNTAEIARKQSVGWVTAQTQIAYIVPAVWLKKITVETKLIAFSASALHMEAVMWDENKTHIKAIMWARLVHFNIVAGHSCKHSAELINFFEQIQFSIGETPTFEERVNTLKQSHNTNEI